MCSAEASAARVSWGRDVKDFHMLDKQVSAIHYSNVTTTVASYYKG
jgi:hypothetical protein